MKTKILTATILATLSLAANPPALPLPHTFTYQWTSGYFHYNAGYGDNYFESPHPLQADWEDYAGFNDHIGNFALSGMTTTYTSEAMFWSGNSQVDGLGKADQHVQQQFRINRSAIRIAGQAQTSNSSKFSLAIYYIREEVNRPILVWAVGGAAAVNFDTTIPVVEGGQYRIISNAAATASAPEAPVEGATWNFVIEEAE